ncbi:MAG: PTS sugar transporter subunit IIA [Erysipelotrichia bacterium]|nr:PTS sugar transporter subunit IIA [Erysipelotrichia bacterium]
MKKKEIQIISYLSQKRKWCTATAIAIELGCTSRCVKTYISNLNDQYNNIIISSRSGYRLSEKLNDNLIIEDNYEEKENRKLWLLRKLLISSKPIKTADLTNELFISFETLEKDLLYIKKQLHNYDLSLRTKNNTLYIKGNDANKREMILDLIYDEMSDSFSDSNSIQSFFPNVNITQIRNIIQSTLKKHNYFIDDFSLINIVLWYTICIEQKQITYTQIDQINYSTKENAHIRQIIQEINAEIKKIYPIVLTEEEFTNLFVLFSTRIFKKDTVKYVISNEIKDLINEIISVVEKNFYVKLDFNNNDVRFALHLQNMLSRIRNNVSLHNLQLAQVKTSFPYTYDIATCIAAIIKHKYGYEISEDEIGYLAIHIGINLEAQINSQSKIRAVLVYPKYFSESSDLSAQIMNIFDKDLLIVNVLSFPDEIVNCEPYDFIISTILFSNYKKNVSFVKSKLDYEDIINISNQIKYHKKNKMKHIFESNLSKLIHEDLYSYSPDYRDSNDAISSICDEMIKTGYIDQEFKKKTLEREKLSSSAFGNIAMPHPISYPAKQSAIAVSILPKGINWIGTENNVNLILTLAINDKDKILFQDIFKLVTDFISNSENFSLLIKAQTCDEFKKMIISFFESNL